MSVLYLSVSTGYWCWINILSTHSSLCVVQLDDTTNLYTVKRQLLQTLTNSWPKWKHDSNKRTVNWNNRKDRKTHSKSNPHECYHHVAPPLQISLTLSRHPSLSSIAPGRSSMQYPVSTQSCCIEVLAGRPAFARPCEGAHRSISLMSSSLLLQLCRTCLVRLTLMVFVMGGCWPYSCCFVRSASRIRSILLAAFLSNCRQAFSPYILLAYK